MLWDLAYSELFFSPKLWPDFGATELDEAVAAYALRGRRYGRDGATTATPAAEAAHAAP